MTSMYLPGVQQLTAADLEAIGAGDSVPGWWWLFLYGVSESQSIVDGFRAGYNPG
jgi:hypothetical protein